MTTQTWQIDSAHSGIHFAVRHLVIAKVRGQFSRSAFGADGWAGMVGDVITLDILARIQRATMSKTTITRAWPRWQ